MELESLAVRLEEENERLLREKVLLSFDIHTFGNIFSIFYSTGFGIYLLFLAFRIYKVMENPQSGIRRQDVSETDFLLMQAMNYNTLL